MRHVHRAALAGGLAATLVVVALLVTAAVIGGEPVAIDGVVYLSGFLVMALAGCVIVGFRPRHAIGWVFVAGGAGTLLASLLAGIAPALGGSAAGWAGLASLELYGLAWIAVTTLPLLLFPDGRPRGRWALAGVWTAAILSAVVAAAIAVGAQPDDAVPTSPLAVPAASGIARTVLDVALFASAVVTVGAAVLLALRWRRSDGLERRRLAWLGVGALVMATLVIVGWVVMTIAPGLPDVVGATAEAVQIAVIPAVMLGAILDARLFDIDVVFRRSVVYTALLALVVAVYAGAIAAASVIAGQPAAVVGSLVASVAVAFALSPVRDGLARLVERRLYGSRRRPAEALSLVGGGFAAADPRAGTDASATLSAAAAAIGSGLRLATVRIAVHGDDPIVAEWAAPDSPRHPVGAAGARNASAEVDLAAFGAAEGTLSVSTAAGDALSDADVALLRQLAPQVALVAHAAQAAAAVQRSREAIVGAREAERLRLRRDLHDGLGPALVGLALEADAAAALAQTDSERARELTGRVAEGLRAVIGDVRSVVEGLRPPDIDQLGLAGALAERARAVTAAGIAVELECDDLDLPAAAEVAAYRIAAEALTNVARHSAARSCRVVVGRSGDDVVVTVVDDGSGFDADAATTGVGLGSMRARAEEIGGTLTITSRGGQGSGATVRAVLPLGTSAPRDAAQAGRGAVPRTPRDPADPAQRLTPGDPAEPVGPRVHGAAAPARRRGSGHPADPAGPEPHDPAQPARETDPAGVGS